MPEHFNLPWLRLLAGGALRTAGVAATWEDYPGGTGSMRDALDSGRLDLAMLLTEGAVAGVANGAGYRIVSLYTQTPLLWGIHVPARSTLRTIDDARGARIAISRFGSGSHLMAYVLHDQRGWPVSDMRFVVVDNLEGAVAAFERGEADVFLWEKFMTKPLVDAQRFRRVGELGAPWPAFVVCAANEALRDRAHAIASVVQAALEEARRFSADPSAPAEIASHYGLRESDAAEWLGTTRWADRIDPAGAALERATALLQRVGLIAPGAAPELAASLPLA